MEPFVSSLLSVINTGRMVELVARFAMDVAKYSIKEHRMSSVVVSAPSIRRNRWCGCPEGRAGCPGLAQCLPPGGGLTPAPASFCFGGRFPEKESQVSFEFRVSLLLGPSSLSLIGSVWEGWLPVPLRFRFTSPSPELASGPWLVQEVPLSGWYFLLAPAPFIGNLRLAFSNLFRSLLFLS